MAEIWQFYKSYRWRTPRERYYCPSLMQQNENCPGNLYPLCLCFREQFTPWAYILGATSNPYNSAIYWPIWLKFELCDPDIKAFQSMFINCAIIWKSHSPLSMVHARKMQRKKEKSLRSPRYARRASLRISIYRSKNASNMHFMWSDKVS